MPSLLSPLATVGHPTLLLGCAGYAGESLEIPRGIVDIGGLLVEGIDLGLPESTGGVTHKGRELSLGGSEGADVRRAVAGGMEGSVPAPTENQCIASPPPVATA